ncbi:MAG: hypothetical protein IKA54_03080 [Clostridia bacterium]|nr:hypothetical protein [Clostridia bacterium]
MAICEDSTLKKKMILITVFLLVLFVVSLPIFLITKNDTIETITITIGITLYHFAMRLVVGAVVNVIMKNKANHNNIWFREKRFESKLYKTLGVRKWKKRLPTYSPETFDFKQKNFEQIVGATCQAEIVHEIIMVFSLLPIIAIPFLGGAVAIIITSVLATLFDFLFVILQRYNRPKLIRVMERFNKTLNKG